MTQASANRVLFVPYDLQHSNPFGAKPQMLHDLDFSKLSESRSPDKANQTHHGDRLTTSHVLDDPSALEDIPQPDYRTENDISHFKDIPNQPLPQIAPVDRLPFELLEKIFCNFADVTRGSFLDDMFLKALFLACARWKEVAEKSPEIWTSIDIQPQEETLSSDFTWTRTRINRWLERASNRPIDIRIIGRRHPFYEGLHPLECHIGRWRSLEIDGTWGTQIAKCCFSAQQDALDDIDDPKDHSEAPTPDPKRHPLFGRYHTIPRLETLS
jgi:hypothetical protein